jgi:hypothetical protein
MNLEEIENLIEICSIDADNIDLANFHKDWYSNPSARELGRLYLIKDFMEAGAKHLARSQQGLVVDRKYLVAWQKNKWRVLNRHNWYYYKNPRHLYENYFKEKEKTT